MRSFEDNARRSTHSSSSRPPEPPGWRSAPRDASWRRHPRISSSLKRSQFGEHHVLGILLAFLFRPFSSKTVRSEFRGLDFRDSPGKRSLSERRSLNVAFDHRGGPIRRLPGHPRIPKNIDLGPLLLAPGLSCGRGQGDHCRRRRSGRSIC